MWGFLLMKGSLFVRLAGVLIKSGAKCCPNCNTPFSQSLLTSHGDYIILACNKCRRRWKLDYAPPLNILLDESDILFYNDQYIEMLLSCKCQHCNWRGLALNENDEVYCLSCDKINNMPIKFKEFCDQEY